MMKCPKCGSRRMAPILYGMPCMDEETQRALRNEELWLGGCCLSAANPRFHCYACGKNAGSAPVLKSRRGQEDCRDIVTAVVYRRGPGRSSPASQIRIVKKRGGIRLAVREESGDGLAPAHIDRALSEDEWDRLMDRLFCRLFLHEWKKRDAGKAPGSRVWQLELRMTGGRVRTWSGTDAAAPYGRELARTFGPFLREARAVTGPACSRKEDADGT